MRAAVYILSNRKNGVLYTGVTSNLPRRIYEHKVSIKPGTFTDRYNCKTLVYFELGSDIKAAIEKEKQIKAGSRKKKIKLIESMNPGWKDLYIDII